MKKKLILLTTLILALTLTLGACKVKPEEDHKHTYATGWTTSPTHHWHTATCEHTTEVSDMALHSFDSNNKCTVCKYEKEVTPTPTPTTTPTPTPTPTPQKTADEAIGEFLEKLDDNFSVFIKPSHYMTSNGGLAQDYSLHVDGKNMHATKDGENYYVEEADGRVYVYTESEHIWHKKLVTEGFEYPDGADGLLRQWLKNVDWQEYDEEKGVANGYVTVENNELYIICTLNDDSCEIEIYSVQYIWGMRYPFIPLGHVVINNIGTTTVTLPENAIEDPVTPPKTQQPNTSDNTDITGTNE